MLKFSHETVLNLEDVADTILNREIDELSEDESICTEVESEIYSLIHFGSTKSHRGADLKKLQSVETNRYFQCTSICHKCSQPGHMARECTRVPQSCFICQSKDHKKANCPEYLCKICRKRGHTEAVCPNKESIQIKGAKPIKEKKKEKKKKDASKTTVRKAEDEDNFKKGKKKHSKK